MAKPANQQWDIDWPQSSNIGLYLEPLRLHSFGHAWTMQTPSSIWIYQTQHSTCPTYSECSRQCCHWFSPTDHSTSRLRALHWLSIEHRIQYKLAVLSFDARTATFPTLPPPTIITNYHPSRSLRSSNRHLCATLQICLPPWLPRSWPSDLE